MSLMRITS